MGTNDVTVYAVAVQGLKGGRFIVESYPDGTGWKITRAGGRQAIASASTPGALVVWADKHGAAAVSILAKEGI